MCSRSQSTQSYSTNRKEIPCSHWYFSLLHYLLIFIQDATWMILTRTLRGILPRSLLRPSCYAQSHQLCLNMGCHHCFGKPPQSSEIFMPYHSHILTKEPWYVGIEAACWSSTATTSCNSNLHISVQQVNVYAKGLEGKCILSVIYMCMGINWCVLIWRKLVYLIFQEFCHAW